MEFYAFIKLIFGLVCIIQVILASAIPQLNETAGDDDLSRIELLKVQIAQQAQSLNDLKNMVQKLHEEHQNNITTEEQEAPFCNGGEILCSNNQKCIPNKYICNGDNDCGDFSDETGCSTASFTLFDQADYEGNFTKILIQAGECVDFNPTWWSRTASIQLSTFSCLKLYAYENCTEEQLRLIPHVLLGRFLALDCDQCDKNLTSAAIC